MSRWLVGLEEERGWRNNETGCRRRGTRVEIMVYSIRSKNE